MPCDFGSSAKLAISGVTNGSCHTCALFNRTWLLPANGADRWTATDSSICGTAVVDLQKVGSTWSLRIGVNNGATTVAHYEGDVDCDEDGNLTLPLSSNPGFVVCGGWPATLTIGRSSTSSGVADPRGNWYPCCCNRGYGSLLLPPFGSGYAALNLCPDQCDDFAAEEYDVEIDGVAAGVFANDCDEAICDGFNTTFRVVFNTTGFDSQGVAIPLTIGSDAWWLVEFEPICNEGGTLDGPLGKNRGVLELFCLGSGRIGWRFTFYTSPWRGELYMVWTGTTNAPDRLCFDGDPISTLAKLQSGSGCSVPAGSTATLRPAA